MPSPIPPDAQSLLRREACVLRHLLEEQARIIPHRIYAVFEDGEAWTFADAWAEACAAAAYLAGQGVGRGDTVLLWAPNGRAFFRTWFGTNLLGAIIAAPNLAYRGTILDHIVALVAPKLAIVDESLIGRLDDVVSVNLPPTLVTRDTPLDAIGSNAGANPPPLPDLDPWDTQLIMFTSGTTGPSKGVIVPYAQLHAMALAQYGTHMTPDDRYLINLPLFHVGGLMPATGALITGGSIAVIERFSTETFWNTVRRFGVTACTMMGAAASFLNKRAAAPDDAANPLKFVSMLPLLPDLPAFRQRFGVSVYTAYGMSELSIPITSEFNPVDLESCGRLRAGFEARIVDEHDQSLPDGESGELVLRADIPWTISPGYWRDAAATASVWRNGWFHTGDRFRRNADGCYYFIDRRKDTIRRRGENISSHEVEAEALSHPSILEAAAIAVPSPFGEDDVMLVGVAVGEIEPRTLFEHMHARLPHFMVPRYIRFVPSLPKTPSLRVQKHLLRDEGLTANTWDREEHNIRVSRDGS